jgi:hypothetical protein
MLDGVIENFTASVLEPYLDGTAFDRSPGMRLHRPRGPQVYRDAARCARLPDRTSTRSGDRAVRQGLDAIEAARQANGMTDTRPPLAHLQIVDPADWPRFRALGGRREHPATVGRNEAADDRADDPVPAARTGARCNTRSEHPACRGAALSAAATGWSARRT